MPATLSIQAKQFGQRRPIGASWSLTLPSAESGAAPMTLRALISLVVTHEVTAFRERQDHDRLLRVLSPAEISQGEQAGKITSGGSTLNQAVEPAEAVATAIQAFEDGIYFVFVDGTQMDALDTPLTLTDTSEVMFLRLVALVGG